MSMEKDFYYKGATQFQEVKDWLLKRNNFNSEPVLPLSSVGILLCIAYVAIFTANFKYWYNSHMTTHVHNRINYRITLLFF